MYRVLVVDDEPLMTDGICDVLESLDTFPVEIRRFYAGERAAEYATDNAVDLLVTDLKMPTLDGHALHERVRSRWPGCKTIFLTGYDRFDDVQRALRDDAADYILKTEDDEELRRAAVRALETLESEAAERLRLAEAEQMRERSFPLLRDAFVADLLHGEVDEGELREGLRTYAAPLEPGVPVLPVIVRLDLPAPPTSRIAGRRVHARIHQMVAAFFDRVSVIGAAYDTRLLGCLLFDITSTEERPPLSATGLVQYANQNASVFQRLASDRYGLGLSLAIGDACVPLERAPLVLHELSHVLSSLYRLDPQVIVSSASVRSTGGPMESGDWIDAMRCVDRIRPSLDAGDASVVRASLEELSSLVGDSTDLPAPRKMELWLRLSADILGFLNDNGLADTVAARRELNALFSPDPAGSLAGIIERLANICDDAIAAYHREARGYGEQVIRAAQAYVRANYDQDLSLAAIAERFHFNASYFSRLFSKHAGESLSEFITSTRLENAREQLRHTSQRVKDVATACGFRTVSHFTGTFKRRFGCTPREFREGDVRE